MKKLILIISTLFICHSALTSQTKDNVIINALSEEINRNKAGLNTEGKDYPTFISYAMLDGRTLKIEATLGSIVQVYDKPMRNCGVRLFLGDYKCNSDCEYNGRFLTKSGSISYDSKQIQRDYWLVTDKMYKIAVTDYASKLTNKKRVQMTKEEEELPDYLTWDPVKKIVPDVQFEMNKDKWIDITKKLSAIFLNYPELYASKVTFNADDYNYYIVNTEGSQVKQPSTIASLSLQASVRTEDGVEYTDNLDLFYPSDIDMPSYDKLKEKTEFFAKTLSDYAKAEIMDEYYSGPVLYLDDAVADIFAKTLVSTKGLLVQRTGNVTDNIFGVIFSSISTSDKKTLEYRIGQRVLDKNLTVSNLSSVDNYNGVKLAGYYQVDGDAVEPEKETVLIENGIMKKVLNGRIPTLETRYTTGSLRLTMESKNIAARVAPGSLLIKGKSTKTRNELVDELINLAKADSLKHAYIITRNDAVNYVYKIDVNTLEQHLVQRVDIGKASIGMLKNIEGISGTLLPINYMMAQKIPSTIIAPDAMLLKDVELCGADVKREKKASLKNPLLR